METVFKKIDGQVAMLDSDHSKFVSDQKDQWSFESDHGKCVLDQKGK